MHVRPDRVQLPQHPVVERRSINNQLGSKPNLNPDGVGGRAASEYAEGENLIDMIKEDLVAERVAIETYRDMVRYFGERDPTTRVLLEKILAQEEEHGERHARPARDARGPADAAEVNRRRVRPGPGGGVTRDVGGPRDHPRG